MNTSISNIVHFTVASALCFSAQGKGSSDLKKERLDSTLYHSKQSYFNYNESLVSKIQLPQSFSIIMIISHSELSSQHETLVDSIFYIVLLFQELPHNFPINFYAFSNIHVLKE